MYKNLRIIFLFILFIGNFLSCFSQKENFKTHLFSYKGFEIEMVDFAQDETGNYLFVGTVKETEMLAKNRDSSLSRKLGYGKNDRVDLSERGMMFYTNSKFELQKIKIIKTPCKVIFDKDKNLFYVGTEGAQELANIAGYEKMAKSAIEILEVNKEIDYKSYSIAHESKLYLKQFMLQNDHLFIIVNQDKFQKSILIEANFKSAKRDTLYPYNSNFRKNYIFTNVKKTEIPLDNHSLIEISEISAVGGAHYFWASSFEQKSLKRNTQFYKYNRGRIEALNEINELIDMQTKGNSNIIINHFSINPKEEITLLFHKGAKEGELFFLKVNKNFETINQYSTLLENYLDFNKVIVLNENTHIILTLDRQKKWLCQYKTNDSKLLKEISTTIDEAFYPMKLMKMDSGKVAVLFTDFKGKSLISLL